MSAQRVEMEDEKIEVVRNWSKSKLVKDMQVFLSFANFYWRFLYGFSKITRPLISMLQKTRLSKNLPSSIDVAKLDEVGVISDGDICDDEMVKRLPLISKNSNGTIGYLTLKARFAFIQLRKVFIKAPILRHFDPEYHIWI